MPDLGFLNAVNGFLPPAPQPDPATQPGLNTPWSTADLPVNNYQPPMAAPANTSGLVVPWAPAANDAPPPASGHAMLNTPAPMTLVDKTGAAAAAHGAAPQPAQPTDGGVSPLGQLQVTQVSGGKYSPAHEDATRGPKAMAALNKGVDVRQDASREASINTQLDAQREQEFYAKQAQEATARQKAATDAAQSQQDELRARLRHMDNTAADLSKRSIDPGHFWASQSTGQKIASTIGLFLGGFGNGSNPAQDIIQKKIDNDIAAQKFSYEAGVEGHKGEQTAYKAAMDMYGDGRIATNVATMAAIDAAKSQASQLAAAAKGTDAKNRALALLSDLENERQRLIADSLRYAPATASGARYKIGGRVGTFTEAQTQAHQDKVDTENRDIAGKVVVEGAKDGGKAAEAKSSKDAALFVPTGADGKGYMARNDAEAKDHRDKLSAADEVIDLVDKITKGRTKLGYLGRVASSLPGGHGETSRATESNGGLLMGAVNRAEHFGALDKGATDVIKGISGDPLAWREAEGVKLQQLRQNAIESKRRLEKSVTGTRPDNVKSLGFVPSGGK